MALDVAFISKVSPEVPFANRRPPVELPQTNVSRSTYVISTAVENFRAANTVEIWPRLGRVYVSAPFVACRIVIFVCWGEIAPERLLKMLLVGPHGLVVNSHHIITGSKQLPAYFIRVTIVGTKDSDMSSISSSMITKNPHGRRQNPRLGDHKYYNDASHVKDKPNWARLWGHWNG